ncbi:MAG: hypothetical protein RR877_00190 [Aurantimicrobium sp.]|uniref:hypothetical protein n=1 Tax=Aurantimicrobium sp. TaxID=1930784 RepID=UPI002FC6B8F5
MNQELNQELFDNLFGDIRWEQAIALLLGDQKVSDEQQAALNLAVNVEGEPFLPMAVGYIGFQVRTNIEDGYSKTLVIVPGNQLIRRRINCIRRSDLAANLNVDQDTADIIFTEVNGWQPAIDYVVSLFDVFKDNPAINDNELKFSHNVCFWKQSQKRAIRALRFYFNNYQPA